VQTLPQLLPTAEIGTAQQEFPVDNTNVAALPTREELAATAYDLIRFWMESGNSQLLSREQALQIAAWGLKIAGERELQTQVLAELVELPENYG
jgi:hypothetical protein